MLAAKHIPVERLGATDDCGFSPFSRDVKPKHGSPDFARDIAMQKIAARLEGAAAGARGARRRTDRGGLKRGAEMTDVRDRPGAATHPDGRPSHDRAIAADRCVILDGGVATELPGPTPGSRTRCGARAR